YSPSRFYPLCPPSPPLPPPPTLFPYTTLFRSVRAAARFRSPSAPPCRPVSPDGKWPLPDAELSHQKRMAAIGRAAHLYEPLVPRSEEHTSELQSRVDLVCRLLLEKKKKNSIAL